LLKRRGEYITSIPLVSVNNLVVFDSVNLTAHAIDLLLNNGVDVVYMSRGGKIIGSLRSQRGGGAVVRLAQFGAFMNPERRLSISKSMVDAKIHNQLSLALKYKYHDTNNEFDANIAAIKSYSAKLKDAETINEVMGIEGVSAKSYWDCYKRLLKTPAFTRRDYRPAPDYVNALLNLGYAFLTNELATCLSVERFDMEIGFLHSVHYGRASLVLDVMEEFRSPFVDAWLLSLLNRKVFKADNFTIQNNDYRLAGESFSKFCGLYHDHVDKWREKFQEQAKQLRIAVMEGNSYEPYRE